MTVQEHYKTLSKEYYKKNNKHCEIVYSEIISRYANGKANVLELGCGDGHMSELVEGRYTGIEMSEEMLNQNTMLKKGDRLIVGNAEETGLDNQFDLVFSINLLEHVKSPRKVINEIQRVLRSDGTAIIITPNGDIGWLLEILEKLHLKLPEGEHRFLKSSELNNLIQNSQLKIIKMKKMIVFPFGSVGRWLDTFNARNNLNLGLFHLLICKN